MAKRSIRDIEKIWSNVEGVRKLSDRAVGFGPFKIGMDGLLAFVPIVGTAYTVGAGGWLLIQGLQAKASPATLARMVGYLGVDSVLTAGGEFIPFGADLLDVVFQGHALAAGALQKDIESTHWVEADEREAKASGEHDRHLGVMRDTGKRRIVYLHD